MVHAISTKAKESMEIKEVKLQRELRKQPTLCTIHMPVHDRTVLGAELATFHCKSLKETGVVMTKHAIQGISTCSQRDIMAKSDKAGKQCTRCYARLSRAFGIPLGLLHS